MPINFSKLVGKVRGSRLYWKSRKYARIWRRRTRGLRNWINKSRSWGRVSMPLSRPWGKKCNNFKANSPMSRRQPRSNAQWPRTDLRNLEEDCNRLNKWSKWKERRLCRVRKDSSCILQRDRIWIAKWESFIHISTVTSRKSNLINTGNIRQFRSKWVWIRWRSWLMLRWRLMWENFCRQLLIMFTSWRKSINYSKIRQNYKSYCNKNLHRLSKTHQLFLKN